VSASADLAPTQSPSPNLGEWAEANHAVDLDQTLWEVTLQGTQPDPVEIVDIVPVLTEPCGEPLRGSAVVLGAEGAGEKIALQTNVSAISPRMDYGSTAFGATLEKDFFASHKITLPRGEKNVLVLQAHTKTKHCRWRYRIDYLDNDGRHSMTLSAPGGKPFEVTASRATYKDYDWVIPPAYISCFVGPDGTLQKISGKRFEEAIGDGKCRPGDVGASPRSPSS
jgi:hypothetical protein